MNKTSVETKAVDDFQFPVTDCYDKAITREAAVAGAAEMNLTLAEYTEKLEDLKNHELCVTYGMSMQDVATVLHVCYGDDTYISAYIKSQE